MTHYAPSPASVNTPLGDYNGFRLGVEGLANQALAELMTEAGQRRGEPTEFERNFHAKLRALLAHYPAVPAEGEVS